MDTGTILTALRDETNHSKVARDLGVTRNQLKHAMNQLRLSVKRFVITSVQNNTELFAPFWRNLETYRDHHGAELIVIPTYYQNENLFRRQEDVTYPYVTVKHFCDETRELHDKVVVIGDMKIQQSVLNPLGSLEAMGQGRSAIFGHSQIGFKSVARPMNEGPLWIACTGSASMPRFRDNTKQGRSATFNHVFGAMVIETIGPLVFYRWLVAEEDGSFIDLDKRFSKGQVSQAERPEALVTGDEHWDYMDPLVAFATYDAPRSLNRELRPKRLVRHDALNFTGESHHVRSDIERYSLHKEGRMDVLGEVELTLRRIQETTLEDQINILPSANHSDHLDKWLSEGHPQVQNLPVYHRLKAAQLEAIDRGEPVGAFPLLARMMGLTDRVEFLSSKEGYVVMEVDLGQHGHQGQNGSRGSAQQFAKAAHKVILGHSHSPLWLRSVLQVGHSCLPPPYVSGYTSWDTVHAILMANGKRTLLPVRAGFWCLDHVLWTLYRDKEAA